MFGFIKKIGSFFTGLFGRTAAQEMPKKPRRKRKRATKPQAAAQPPKAKEPKPPKQQRPRQEKPAEEPLIAFDESWQPPKVAKEKEGDVLFQELDLDARILQALLRHLGFTKCSPIQGQALPKTLQGVDLAGRAQTGTGKTAAFLITILQYFLTKDKKEERDGWQPLAIILAPTRELALQIANDAADISIFCPEFKTVAVFGGMDYDKQMTALSTGVDLVVATPGRLLDYLRKHAVDLKKVKIAVIDEADRMLDMGFIPDVRRIMGYLNAPEQRQTMLFSATLSHDIMQLASQWMRPNPLVVEIEPEHVLAEGIEEVVYSATTAEKIPIILWIYAHEDCHRVLIFRNRKRDVETLAETLKKCGIPCEMLTGDVEQRKRLRILEDFKAGRLKTIVATDVAGRGIHVDDVTHVINFDLPYEGEDYVHRVGRTARAGHKGRAISFADEDSSFVIPEIEKIIERPLPITQPDDDMLVMPEKINLASTRSSGSHRNANYAQQYSAPRRRPSTYRSHR